MNPSIPLVTVAILSHNRKEELRNTLYNLIKQDYKNIEIIVADNCSTDGSPNMVELNFPDVKLIRLSKNLGIEAYNYILKEANGKYYLILDDDSFPEKSALSYGISFLEQNIDYFIVTFKIFNNGINEIETKDFKIENPYLFHGCGSIWKSQVYEKLGGYDADYFLYYNEIDLTIRCYNSNMKIKYLEDKIVFHQNITIREENKDYHQHKLKYEQFFTGHIRFLIKHFNYKYVIIFSIKWILNRFIIALKFNYYSSFFKSLLRLPKTILSSHTKRNPVNPIIQNYYRNGNIPLIDRDFFPQFKKPY